MQTPVPQPAAVNGDSAQQGLFAAYELLAFYLHRLAADQRYSLGPEKRNMRLAVVLILIATANSVQAIQPVESGLQLLLDRQRIILSEQKLLSQSLQSSTTEPEERAAAYRTYMTIELEKRQLECEIERATRWATSPLVMHAVPAADVSCQSDLTSRFSGAPPASAEHQRLPLNTNAQD